jgi:hypothetical protein
MIGKALLAVAIALVLAGCAERKRSASLRTVVAPSCLTAPIVMQDCNLSAEPPRCRKIKISYRKGCEQLDVSGAKAEKK